MENNKLQESEMKFQALAMAKELHSRLAELTFIDMLSVMNPTNPAKKEVQALETKINELTTEVGSFIQKYIPDVADAEAGDESEIEEPEDEKQSKPFSKPFSKPPVKKSKPDDKKQLKENNVTAFRKFLSNLH